MIYNGNLVKILLLNTHTKKKVLFLFYFMLFYRFSEKNSSSFSSWFFFYARLECLYLSAFFPIGNNPKLEIV